MAFSAQFGVYNIQASINDWFQTNITAAGLPTWMPSARVVFDYGVEKPLISGYSGHAFSVTHMDSNPTEDWQGRIADGQTGHKRAGMFEVNCWIDKQKAGAAHVARMREMVDMTMRLVTKTRGVALYDFYGSTASAASLTAVARLDEPQIVPVGPDVNPDILRTRILIPYNWIMRW